MKKLELQDSMIEFSLLHFICYRTTRDKFASFPLASSTLETSDAQSKKQDNRENTLKKIRTSVDAYVRSFSSLFGAQSEASIAEARYHRIW
jgi:ribosomal protein L9